MNATNTESAEQTSHNNQAENKDHGERVATTSTRKKLIDTFGKTDDIDIEEESNCVIGNNKIVAWVPENEAAPFRIERSEYTSVTEWEETTTSMANFDDDNVETQIYVISGKENFHVIDAETVDEIASTLGVTPESLLENVEMKDGMQYYPVLFDVDGGSVLVTPYRFVSEREELDF